MWPSVWFRVNVFPLARSPACDWWRGRGHFLPGDSPRDGGDVSRYGEPLPGNGRRGEVVRVVDDFTTRRFIFLR